MSLEETNKQQKLIITALERRYQALHEENNLHREDAIRWYARYQRLHNHHRKALKCLIELRRHLKVLKHLQGRDTAYRFDLQKTIQETLKKYYGDKK